MHPILCLILITALAECNNSMNRTQKIQLQYGEDVNVTAARIIIADEARIVGVTEDEHFDHCTVSIHDFLKQVYPSPEENHAWKFELEYASMPGRMNSTDDVFPHFAEHYPKTYAIVMRRLPIIEQYVAKLDPFGQELYRNATHRVLSTFVEISQVHADMSADERRQLVAAGWYTQKKKYVFELFDNIPEESMNNFEKVFCIRTRKRIAAVPKEEPEEIDDSFEFP